MKVVVSISIEEAFLEYIEKKRGNIPRSKYIVVLLEDALKNGYIKK